MKIRCKLIFNYPTSDMTDKIRNALEVDNYRFIQTDVDNDRLVVDMKSESVMSLLHTLEDYLSCLGTAENVIIQTEETLTKESCK